MIYFAVFISFILGSLVGSILQFLINYHPEIGSLKIDTSDGEPYAFLVMKKDPRILEHEKKVVLKIDRTNFITRK